MFKTIVLPLFSVHHICSVMLPLLASWASFCTFCSVCLLVIILPPFKWENSSCCLCSWKALLQSVRFQVETSCFLLTLSSSMFFWPVIWQQGFGCQLYTLWCFILLNFALLFWDRVSVCTLLRPDFVLTADFLPNAGITGRHNNTWGVSSLFIGEYWLFKQLSHSSPLCSFMFLGGCDTVGLQF